MKALASVPGLLVLATIIAAAAQTPPIASIGPKLGSAAPAFSAGDQFGRRRTLQSLIDRDGLMLVFFRSADW